MLAKMRKRLCFLALALATAQMCAGQHLSVVEPQPPNAAPVVDYLELTGQPLGTPLTASMLYSSVVPTNADNFIVAFSENAPGQFTAWTNGPALSRPAIYPGPGDQAIQLSNSVDLSTIEFAVSATNQPYLAVSGFLEVPALFNAPATYDLIVLASVLEGPPYSAEDWTLQLNCGETNLIQFEDAGNGTTVKYGATPFPTDTWLYFTMVMDTTHLSEYGAVFNATDGSLITSYKNTMDLTNSYIDYWLFGNNESGSQAGASIYFSGLNWTNTAQTTPPEHASQGSQYLLASDQFVQFWKSADLSKWIPWGPITNQLPLSATDATAYFRAQATAQLSWTSPSTSVMRYLVRQWYQPTPTTSVYTNLYTTGAQTNVVVPLLGMGTNWFAVAPMSANNDKTRTFSNRVVWMPAPFTITITPPQGK